MNQLVFLEPNRLDAEPFTTTKVISEFSEVSHRYIKKQISSHTEAFLSFGLLVAYATESTGGRPEEITKLNEQQAYFLMTLLKNTPMVVEFKRQLVRCFFLMRQELTRRQILRAAGKLVRRTLTDAIRDSGENERMHGHAYSKYTDLAYKFVAGKTARQLRLERGAEPKATATDFLTADELERYNTMENRITVLLDMGLQYDRIKHLMLYQLTVKAAS